MRESIFGLFEEKDGVRDNRFIIIVLSIAFIWRLPLLVRPEVIQNDGIIYIQTARSIFTESWGKGFMPPLYPLLIACARFFAGSHELGGIAVSVIFGTLTVIPVFYLAKELFNSRIGFFASLFCAVHPYLYKYSGSVLTDSTYAFFLTCSILFGLHAFNKGRVIHVFLFSFCTAFAYLLKPEGIGFIVIFLLWIIFINPPQLRRTISKKVIIVLITVFFVLSLSMPYLLYLKKEGGTWQISKKVSFSVSTLTEESHGEGRKMIARRHIEINSLFKDPLGLGKKMVLGIIESLNKFQQIAPAYLLLILIFNYFITRHTAFYLKQNLFVLSFHVFLLGIVFPFFMVTQRYVTNLIPATLPLIGYSFSNFVYWLWNKIDKSIELKRIYAISTSTVLIILCIHGIIVNDRGRIEQRELGLWMKANLTKQGSVSSRTAQEAFYSERDWVYNYKKGFKEIVDYAKLKKTRYLIIDDADEPSFWEDSRKSGKTDVVLVYENVRNHMRLKVFELVYGN